MSKASFDSGSDHTTRWTAFPIKSSSYPLHNIKNYGP